jgi:hypothetical protein
MGTGHPTGGARGPGCTSATPTRLRKARGSGSLLGDPGLVNVDYPVGFGGANTTMSWCPTALLIPSA